VREWKKEREKRKEVREGKRDRMGIKSLFVEII
jgi:hypothetical protein